MNENIYAQCIKGLAVLIFILGTLFYCYEFFIQVAPSVMSDALMRDFAVNATGLGLISGSFYWTYTTLQIPAGLLLDKYGARLILCLVSVLCALGALLFAIAPDVSVAVLGRIFMGAASAFAFTGVIYLVIRWFPTYALATLVGVLQLIGCVGAIGGESVLAKLLDHFAWRDIMLSLSAIGFVIAVITWLSVRNKPATFVEEEAGEPYSMTRALGIVLKKPQTWFMSVYAFAVWGPILAFAALWGIPFLGASLHLSARGAANAVAFVWIGIGVGSPLIGWASDAMGRRCILLTISAFIGLASVLVIMYVSHLTMPVLYTLLFVMGLAASGQSLIFGVVKDNNHTNTSGAANGFTNMTVVLGGIILQPVIGKLLDLNWSGVLYHGVRIYNLQDYRMALLVLPACFLLAVIMSIFFIRETYCKPVY
jgi:sugar phosphate permease